MRLRSPVRLRTVCPRTFAGPCALALLALAVLPLAACKDSADVGLGSIGGGGGDPEGLRLPASSVAAATQRDFTGGVAVRSSATSTTFVGAAEAVAGTVSDPLLGTTSATAYLDFDAPGVLGSGSLSTFRAGTVTAARLELIRTGAYGDTLNTVRYRLRPVLAEFTTTALPSDTAFALGDAITTVDVPAGRGQSTVRVPLPAAWVAANDTTLRSTAVTTSLRGFALEPVSGGAVLSFGIDLTRLVAKTATDSVAFLGLKGASTIRRTATGPALPSGRVLLQDGYPQVLDLDLPLDSSAASGRGVSRAALVVRLDSALVAANTPGGFYRPLPARVELVGVDATGADVLVGTSYVVRSIGTPTASRVVFASEGLRAQAQLGALGQTPTVARYRLRVPVDVGGLGALVVLTSGADRPAAVLTVIAD